MNAAVVRSFDEPPEYEPFEEPVPSSEHEALVEVLAAGFHPRVRSQANGSHYTATGSLPLVPGIDGVGRLRTGQVVYFALDEGALGSMAERTVIDTRRSIVLPDGTDPYLIAAAMNPGMSSWIALKRRIEWKAGQSVLILGATGNAGRLAIQISKQLGASRVIAAGRNQERLDLLGSLGADVVVQLDFGFDAVSARVGAAAAEVDVVLDYIWGQPALDSIIAIVKERADRSRLLTWVQIGAQAGATVQLDSALLRQANLCLMGSGQGSIGVAGMLEELPSLAAALSDGTIDLRVEKVPLSQVGRVWEEPMPADRRLVFTP